MSVPEEAREAALWRLAERLVNEMEHMDPSETESWVALTPRQKAFYLAAVEGVLCDQETVCAALGINWPYVDYIVTK